MIPFAPVVMEGPSWMPGADTHHRTMGPLKWRDNKEMNMKSRPSPCVITKVDDGKAWYEHILEPKTSPTTMYT